MGKVCTLYGMHKVVYNIDDSEWSDEESDYILRVPQAPQPPFQEAPFTAQQKYPCNQKIFSGHAKLCEPSRNIKPKFHTNSIDIDTRTAAPAPYLSPHAYEMLGREVIQLLWKKFIDYDADETGLMEYQHLSAISDEVRNILNYDLPFDKIVFDEEYIDFKFVIDCLVLHLNSPGRAYLEPEPKIVLPQCCAFGSCAVHAEIVDENEDFECFQAFVHFRSQLKGAVRIKHVPDILDQCDVAYDKSLLPLSFWYTRSDFILTKFSDFTAISDIIRLDAESRKKNLDIYRLPRWLQNEFTPSEIALFKHHFMMIDIDRGGSIDVEELQALTESLGNKVTLEEAQHLIDEHDADGSGTIDFEEFMSLMFKIQHGTIDIENDALGKAMLESRSQIKIFDEIEDIQRNPPEHVGVYSYGGSPISCDYILSPPEHSIYAGGRFLFRIIYANGYPFKCPECMFLTRIFSLNIVQQPNGNGIVPHVQYVWETSWNSRLLLEHVLSLLIDPNPTYLLPDTVTIINSFLKENFEIEDDSVSVTSAFAEGSNCNSQEHSGTLHSKETYRDLVNTLPRIEQMHLNVVGLFFSNREKYNDIAGQYVQKFATKRYDISSHNDEN